MTIKQNLPLFDGMVNPSVLPENELRLSRQCRMIFNRFKCGPATNKELQTLTKSMAISTRVSDVRKELNKYGWTVQKQDSKDLPRGVNRYAMINGNGDIVNG